MLRRLCHQIVPAIPGADLASVAVLDDNHPRTIAAISDQAKDIGQRQYDADSGPTVEAARTGKLVRVAVPDTAARWPQFADAALAAWVGSYLSAPLFLDEKFSGSLNLYGVDGHGFSELDAALLELYTTAAEAAIRQAERHRSGRETAAGLSAALTTRAVIDQAKGHPHGSPTKPSPCSSNDRSTRTSRCAPSPSSSIGPGPSARVGRDLAS